MDQAQQSPELVVGVIPGLQRRKGFLSLQADMYSLVLTSSRLVFAIMTAQMQKDAVMQARETAQQQGKNALGQWGAQFGWTRVLVDRYLAMSPDAILAEGQANFAVPNDQVKKARVKVDIGGEDTSSSTRLEIETTTAKHTFEVTTGSSNDIKRLLQQTLGPAVK